MAVYNDHPELFWLNTVFTCKYDQNKICAELELEFNMTLEELTPASRTFYNITNEILSQVQGLSVNEKERRLHDILIDRVEYDKGVDKNQSAYSALVDGKSVCAGYARAYQYLMQRTGPRKVPEQQQRHRQHHDIEDQLHSGVLHRQNMLFLTKPEP